ncbi:MAG: Hpt domain-containing protein [Bacteroidales bacterium]|nr:Hpt domain-containing protein [Bacteroidales bacterium]HNW72964.1 Hpt domain-containing protein [Bacteroidales bacterium]HPS50535.1 Hpt domain-containing protein [Bacteroidales bacterium]
MIDRKKFNENFQYFDKEIIIEIIDIFFSEYDERFEKLSKNVKEQDFVQLKFNAHSLKGVVANFMDPVTIDLSRRLDEAAKNKEKTGLDILYQDLVENTAKLLEELKVIRKELTS